MPSKRALREVLKYFLFIFVSLFSGVLTPVFAEFSFPPDSLIAKPDSSTTDSNLVLSPPKVKKSKLEDRIEYAADSMRFQVTDQKLYLFGNAEVNYGTINLKANYIELSLKDDLLYARGSIDSTGKTTGDPVFKDKGQEFTSKEMNYNFATKKGKIKQAITQEGDGYIHGSQIKKMSDDVLYVKDGKYTTCSHPDPHFHLQTNKLKIIKNNKIVTGPVYMVVEDVPTPLALPFGFFPNKKGKSSGIIIPTYGQSPSLGFFFSNLGYYFNLGDNFDLKLTGDIYTKGSWLVRATTNYKKRYKFNGNLSISYSQMLRGDPLDGYLPEENFFVKWSHVQDPKARPNSNFSASVNAGSSSYYKSNLLSNTQDFFQNTFQSSIRYQKNFANTPFSVAVSASHDQNTNTGIVNVTLPQATFTMSRIHPFKRKKATGKKRWYEKFGLSYTGDGLMRVSQVDTSFFNNIDETMGLLQSGIRHKIPIALPNFKLFKHINFNPGMDYSDTWYFQHTKRDMIKNENGAYVDSTQTIDKFSRFSNFGFSASASTNLYGMYTFKSGWLSAVRHKITPSVSFSLRPDFSSADFGYYDTYDRDTTGTSPDEITYSKLSGVYGSPTSGASGTVGFSIIQSLEIKVKAKKDTTKEFKKIKLLENVRLGSSYNIFKDSLNWAPINLTAWTTILKNFKVNFSATLNPYAYFQDPLTLGYSTINTAAIDANQGFLRLTNMNIAVTWRLAAKKKKEQKKPDYVNEIEWNYIQQNPHLYVDFNIPWSLNISYNFRYQRPYVDETITNTINLSGDLNITKNWKVGFSTGYDFVRNKISENATSFNIYRNLHCWEIVFRLTPFGDRQSFDFTLKAKSSILQDLKLNRKKQWFDN